MFLPQSPSRAQLVNFNVFQAQAELSSENQNLFELKLRQACILTHRRVTFRMSNFDFVSEPSRASPAQAQASWLHSGGCVY